MDVPGLERKGKLTLKRFEVSKHKSGFFAQSLSFLQYAISVKKYIKNQNYDLIFASSSRFMTAFLAASIKKNNDSLLFLDIRDIFLDTIAELFSGPKSIILNKIFEYVEKYTINKADSVNLVSEGFKDYFLKKYPKKNYTFISNGIDSIFLDSNSTDLKNKRKKIIYAGNIGFGQGLHKIIPNLALKIINDWDIYLIGDGSAKSNLLKEIKQKRISNVFIKDPVKQDELIKQYNKADVLFLHLNDFDAFKKVLPSKIFEYGASGKPILAGVAGYAKKFINSEIINSAVFPPCNEMAALKSLSHLSLGLTDRKDFKKKYNRNTLSDSLAQNIIDLIK